MTGMTGMTGMTEGFVTFRLGDRGYAARLAEVREIVRLDGLSVLPGMTPPLAGVLDLRGVPLPVLDVRPEAARRSGIVLVLEPDVCSEPLGVAVDEVLAVNPEDLRPGAAVPPTGCLPAYVVEVLGSAAGPVFLVDLRRMFGVAVVA